jgi:hypothetical protein
MDQQAKKHLQEEFDAALEEKDQMITVLQTQVFIYNTVPFSHFVTFLFNVKCITLGFAPTDLYNNILKV